MKYKKINKYQIFMVILVVVMGIFSLLAALNTSMENAPDEDMRWPLSQFMSFYMCLPIGNEMEIISKEWGFSYAYTPYLPQILAAILMRIVHVFNSSEDALFTAFRMINVIGFVVAGIYACKIAGLMKEKYKKAFWLYPVFILMLPQLVFISSYMNEDMFSVMSCLMLLYYLMKGHKTEWSKGSCIGLGVSMAICALTYYFGYAWVIFAVIYAVVDCLRCEKTPHYTLKRGGLTACVAFLLAGWYFIRNVIIYDGDITGLNAMHEQALWYERVGGGRRHPKTIYELGVSWADWFRYTGESFVGTFSYMSVSMPTTVYIIYAVIILIGLVAALIYLAGRLRRQRRKTDRDGDAYTEKLARRRCRRLFGIGLLACFLVPLCMSIYRSATHDMQYQGRYIMSGLPALAYAMVVGFDEITSVLTSKSKWLRFDVLVGILWAALFVFAFVGYIYKMNLAF